MFFHLLPERLKRTFWHSAELAVILAIVYSLIHWAHFAIPEELSTLIIAAIVKFLREVIVGYLDENL